MMPLVVLQGPPAIGKTQSRFHSKDISYHQAIKPSSLTPRILNSSSSVCALHVRKNPGCNISETKRAIRDLLVSKRPDFWCHFKFKIRFWMCVWGGGTVHWDNFAFGQNSKSLLVFRNGLVGSFGILFATFDKQTTKWGCFDSKCVYLT